MSMKDKGHLTNKRVAAVSFLNNISLDGTYKDNSWNSEFDKLVSYGGETVSSSQESIFRRGSLNSEHYPNDHQRQRANTGSFSQPHRGGHRSDSITSGLAISKHAHFTSNESFEPENQMQSQKISLLNLKSDSTPIIKDERLVIFVSHRTPLVIFSVLSYSRESRQSRGVERSDVSRRGRNSSGSRPVSTIIDPDPLELLVHSGEEEVSYGRLLKPTQGFTDIPTDITDPPRMHVARTTINAFRPRTTGCYSYDAPHGGGSCSSTNAGISPNNEGGEMKLSSVPFGAVGVKSLSSNYSPHMLDDPEFRAGRHRTLLTFPSYITSVIDYCKASDMKKELNDKFKDRFPHILLTLSKLRSLKREMRRVAKAEECNIDLLTVAQAFVYFEKLILGSFVTKYNRKFCAGACLLLSAKLNDVKGNSLHNLIEVIEKTFRVNRKDLLSFEFAVLIALEFTLHLPTWEVFPHYQRLLYES